MYTKKFKQNYLIKKNNENFIPLYNFTKIISKKRVIEVNFKKNKLGVKVPL